MQYVASASGYYTGYVTAGFAIRPAPNGGDDLLMGGAGRDMLYGGEGNDTLDGGTEDDSLFGNDGDDWLFGGEGADWLVGDNGEDLSGEGNDTLDGGSGNDTLYGLGATTPSAAAMMTMSCLGFRATTCSTAAMARMCSSATTATTAVPATIHFTAAEAKISCRVPGVDDSLYGGSEVDMLLGQDGNDTLYGEQGNDELQGGVGNDLLDGGEGNDLLFGDNGDGSGSGNDILHGGDGNDELQGHGGNDELHGDAGDDNLFGFSGDDLLVGGSGSDYLAGGSGANRYIFYNGDGAGESDLVNVDEGSNLIELADASLGDLEIQLAPTDDHVTIQYSTEDRLTVLHGRSSSNLTFLVDGRTYTYGELASTATVAWIGTAGNDSLTGGPGSDILYGRAGDDVLQGGAGADRLYGETGRDTLYGGEGDDLLVGGSGSDELFGGPGNDEYVFAPGDSLDYVSDPEGDNTLSFEGQTAANFSFAFARKVNGVYVKEEAGDGLLLTGSWGNTIFLADGRTAGNFTFAFADGELGHADILDRTDRSLQGDNGDNMLVGKLGNDTLSGNGGNDVLLGGAGNDSLSGGDDNDLLVGGAGVDYLDGGNGVDTVSYADDTAGVVVRLWKTGKGGTAEGDTYKNIENIIGGKGADILEVEAWRGVLEGGPGADKLYGRNGSRTTASYRSSSTGVEVNLVTGKARGGDAEGDSLFDITSLVGSEHNDILTGWECNTQLTGLGGDDVLIMPYSYNGGDGELNGGKGNDYLYGSIGNDKYFFSIGDGADTIIDSNGQTGQVQTTDRFGHQSVQEVRVEKWSGSDAIVFGENIGLPDLLLYGDPGDGSSGLAADDLVIALKDPGNPTASWQELHDKLIMKNYFSHEVMPEINIFEDRCWVDTGLFPLDRYGWYMNSIEDLGFSDYSSISWDNIVAQLSVVTDGDDRLEMVQYNNGNTSVTWDGLAGNDILIGASGNDILIGGAGVDQLRGHCGNDELHGGGGDDILNGGNGNDRYVFGRGDGNDTVSDPEKNYITDSSGNFEEDDGAYAYVNRYSTLWQVQPGAAPSSDTLLLAGDIRKEDLEIYWTAGAEESASDDLLIRIRPTDESQGHLRDSNIAAIVNHYKANPLRESILNSETGEYEDVERPLGDSDLIAFSDKALRHLAYQISAGEAIGLASSFSAVMTYLEQESLRADFNREYRSEEDTILLKGYFNRGRTIENITLVDSRYTLTSADILNLMSSDSAEMIRGFDWTANTIHAGGGNDIVVGGSQNDTLYGDAGNDTLQGGAGNDLLAGGDGDDTYVFNAGDGVDRIVDSGGTDTIRFDDRITADSLSLGLGSLLVRVGEQAEAIHLEDFNPEAPVNSSVVEKFEFADGTILGIADLLQRGFDIYGSAGDDRLAGTALTDRISGGDGADILIGGKGDDILDGGSGRDIYVANIGDGIDRIIDAAAEEGGNTIQFGQGIGRQDIVIAKGGSTLTVGYDALGSKLLVENFDATGAGGFTLIDTFAFADGSTVSYEDLLNHAPETGPAELPDMTLTEDQPFLFQLPEDAFLDADGDPLQYRAEGRPGWLQFDETIRTLSGTPGNDDVGGVTLTFSAVDPSGKNTSRSLAVTVTNVNDAPTVHTPLEDQAATEDQPFSVRLPADTFRDVDAGDRLVLSAARADGRSLPGWLNFDPATGIFAGTPVNEDVGTLAVMVTAADLAGVTATSDFALKVINTNDAPEVTGEKNILLQDVREASGQIAASDPDGDVLNFSLQSRPANGDLVLDEHGVWQYHARALFIGTDQAVVAVDDGNGGVTSANLRFDVRVSLPVVADQILGLDEDTELSGILPVNNPVGGALTCQAVGDAGHGLFAIDANGNWRYTPQANYHGEDSVRIKVTNEYGLSDEATLALTVVPVNDVPLVAAEERFVLLALPVLAGQINATDIDGDSLRYDVAAAPGHGVLTVDDQGQWQYRPAAGYFGEDWAEVAVSDGAGGVAATRLSFLVNTYTGGDLNLPEETVEALDLQGVGKADLSFTKDGSALVIDIREKGSIRVNGYFAAPENGIKYLHTTDGSVSLEKVCVVEASDPWSVLNGAIHGLLGEKLLVDGTSRSDFLSGAIDNDVLFGSGSNDEMIGLWGDDTLVGGTGNDFLFGNDGNDTVYGDEGNDKLFGGSGEDFLIGGEGNDQLQGEAGNDHLDGGAGNDRLTGGCGNDTFVFDSVLNKKNKDTIADFVYGQDKIELDRSIFSALPAEGTLASYFRASACGKAADDNDYILYNTTSGALLYDADGSGQGVAIEFATLMGKPTVKAEDFVVAS